jgi:hypothetical protein
MAEVMGPQNVGESCPRYQEKYPSEMMGIFLGQFVIAILKGYTILI